MTRYEIIGVPVLGDNYIWVVTNRGTRQSVVIDPAEAEPVVSYCHAHGLKPVMILNTHHHGDHVGGNQELKHRYTLEIVASAADRHRIPGIDRGIRGGDEVRALGLLFQVLDTPGHTAGHVSYYCPALAALFCGDTLFSLGCGRLFEGTAEQLRQSLAGFRRLPADTLIHCAHEYTQANARFALTVDPGNPDLARYAAEVERKRESGLPAVPSRLEDELACNPFLRAGSAEIARNLGLPGKPEADVFAELRRRKDVFR